MGRKEKKIILGRQLFSWGGCGAGDDTGCQSVVRKTLGKVLKINMKCGWDKIGPLCYFSETLKKIRIPFLKRDWISGSGFIKVLQYWTVMMVNSQTVNMFFFFTPLSPFESLSYLLTKIFLGNTEISSE